MFKQIILLALLATVSIAQYLSGWTHCGTTMADIHHIIVSDCVQTPCSFVRGNTYRLQITATALVYSDSLNYELTADFIGFPFSLVTGNGCNNLVQGECPVTIGNTFSYILDYPVPVLFPSMETFVQLDVRHHNGTQGICVRVDVYT